jgi:Putative zinc-finger
MSCRRVEKSLPLFVGRDLTASRLSEIAAHLAACERCRGHLAELEAGLAFLEASPPPPFAEADYDTLRRAVRRRIESGAGSPAGGRASRLILASAGILAVAFAAILVLRARVELPRAAGVAASTPRVEAAVAALPATPLEEPSPPAPVNVARNSPRRPARPAGRGAATSVVRIEFQTANPDVRIIWLVKKGETAPAAAPAGRNQEVS